VIDPVSANILYEKVSSKVREIVWFHKSGHEMLNDVEEEGVFDAIMDFVNRFRRGGETQEAPQTSETAAGESE
jgi:hypothetical protein